MKVGLVIFDRCSNLEPRLGLIASQWDISLVQVVCQTPSLINIKIINFTCLLLGAALPLLGGFAEREVMILSKHFLASTQMKIDYFEAVVFPFSLFLASVLICQVFIIFCIDFNLQTPIQREKIFQYFYSTGFFYQYLPNHRWCDAVELGEQVLPAFKRFHGEKVNGRNFP